MATKDKRVDAFIGEAAPFARPILKHIRTLVHRNCPKVSETIKWGMPFFEHDGILCFMAAFKAHCAFGFWRGRLDRKHLPEMGARDKEAMGQFGRLTSIKDLPSNKTMSALIKQAMQRARSNSKSVPKKPRPAPKPVVVPDFFMAALKKNRVARAAFEKFTPSHKREWIEWLTSAKHEETRLRRLAKAMSQLEQGKTQG